MARLGVNVKTALSVAVFNKSLRLASTATKTSSTGQVRCATAEPPLRRARAVLMVPPHLGSSQIVNIMSNDASQVQRFTTFATMIVLAPFQVTVALFLIYQQVQEAAFVGLAFIALMTPLNACIFMRVRRRTRCASCARRAGCSLASRCDGRRDGRCDGRCGAQVGKLRRRVLLFTDDRVKLMNEILSGIRVIKVRALAEAQSARAFCCCCRCRRFC